MANGVWPHLDTVFQNTNSTDAGQATAFAAGADVKKNYGEKRRGRGY